MKKLLLSSVIAFLLVTFTTEIKANVYASGFKISDDTVSTYQNAPNTWDGNFVNGGVKIWFIINESGGGTLTATVTIKQGATTIRTLNVPSPQKGVNSIIWDGWTNASTPAPIGNYSFEVLVSDPVGHTTFDSLWVAGGYYQGLDPDSGTAYAYRGNTAVREMNTATYGNIYVARGTTTANGYYEFRADGEYVRKIGTDPAWTGSVPNELMALGNVVWGLAGYGFTNAGYTRGYSALTGSLHDTLAWGVSAVRGLWVRYEGGDTVFYTTRSNLAGETPVILKKVGVNGAETVALDMSPYITGNGYIKQVVIDDGNNFWVIYGNTAATRNRVARFNSLGVPFFDSSLVSYGLPTGAYFHSMALDRGPNTTTSADDKIYFLVYGGVNPSPASGIYTMDFGGEVLTQLVSPAGVGTGATSLIINVDPVGNVIWSNGNVQERIVLFSPASGPNSHTTESPTSLPITVTNPVPVELTSFTASVTGSNVELRWTTATELNNRGFEVEKRLNNNWQVIGFVAGSGTTTEIQSYSFTDKNVTGGSYAYRIKQMDYDGKFEYSDIVEVEVLTADDFRLSQNYPNPFNPSTTINFLLPIEAKVHLAVFSINGELVKVLVDDVRSAGSHDVTFDASSLASGTYVYRLTSGDITLSKKMLLIK
jgi:hypothetical protein